AALMAARLLFFQFGCGKTDWQSCIGQLLMPGQLPGSLKNPQPSAGTALSSIFPGCQRQRPLRQTRSRVGVFSRYAFSRSHTARTPLGSGASPCANATEQATIATDIAATSLD